MDEIEIKITFEDDLAGCEITKGDNITHFEELERSEQIQVCNSLGRFYALFYNYIANQ